MQPLQLSTANMPRFMRILPLLCCVLVFLGCSSETQTSQNPSGVDSTEKSSAVAGDNNSVSSRSVIEVTEKNEEDSDRSLPMPKDPGASADTASEPAWEPNDGPTGEEIAAEAFLPPAGATAISKSGKLWIDPGQKRVYIDGYVTMNRGPMEMFACPVGTKEHESIVALLAQSKEVHAALLAVGAKPGTPVEFQPEFKPPTGQVIRVWACWFDKQGKFKAVDARQWIQDLETEKPMNAVWVFAGSSFWQDPEDKKEYYQADSGDMICVSNFSSAMLDVAIPSSASEGELRFMPFEDQIPELDTPVRLVLVPEPAASKESMTAEQSKRLDPPTGEILKRSPKAKTDAQAK